MRKIYLLYILCLLCFSELIGQKYKRELEVGGKLINELTSADGWAIGLGGQIVYKMSKHSGVESGLFYQSRPVGFNFYVFTGTGNIVYTAKIAEHRILFPLLYRFSSRFINFSTGPVMDYFLGWKTKSAPGGITINSYNRNALQFTATAGISKSINLTKSWILEPEVKYNLHLSEEDFGPAFNISLRKKIF